MKDHNWFKDICVKNSLVITDEQLLLLGKFVDLLILKNQEINLISQKSESNIWEDHILHSLSFLFYIKLKKDAKILDLGSGGGLPGIPLKILFPQMGITLLDSTKKKIIADNEIIKSLELKNIKGISERAEEINNKTEYQNKFDYVTARAVSSLENIVNWSVPFLKPDSDDIFEEETIPTGSIIVLKGGDIDEEVRKIKNNKYIKQIKIIDLNFEGSASLANPDKKIIIITVR
jgi:16S rRNA (guanine527-N7)-methyltransferase